MSQKKRSSSTPTVNTQPPVTSEALPEVRNAPSASPARRKTPAPKVAAVESSSAPAGPAESLPPEGPPAPPTKKAAPRPRTRKPAQEQPVKAPGVRAKRVMKPSAPSKPPTVAASIAKSVPQSALAGSTAEIAKSDGARLSILMVTPEAHPFAKTGGLAEVAAALPQALVALGHDVTLVLPRYRRVDTSATQASPISFRLGNRPVSLRSSSSSRRPESA